MSGGVFCTKDSFYRTLKLSFFMKQLFAFQQRFNPLFKAQLLERINRTKSLTKEPLLRMGLEHLAPLLLQGGKRLRPYLAHLMYRALSGKTGTKILPCLSALEFFQAFALMHDDIMDRGALRHGQPTMHRFVHEQLIKRKRLGDLAQAGTSQAILIGDLLHTWTHEHLIRPPQITRQAWRRAVSLFMTMAEEVIVGQMIDIDLTTQSNASLDSITKKMLLKTASYTVIRPLQIGAALGGARPAVHQFCASFGRSLGLAFQIQDDLVDLIQPSKQLKKTTFSDLTDRAATYFTYHMLNHGTQAQQRAFKKIFGTTLTEADRPRILTLLTNSGAIAFGRKMIRHHFSRAEQLLKRAPLPEHAKQELHDLMEYLHSLAPQKTDKE